MKTILLLLTATLMPAQDVAVPSIGMMTDARGSLRPVYGVAGSFVVGEEAGAAETGPVAAPPKNVIPGIDGEVLSIGPGPRIAVRRDSGVWIVRPDGAVLDALPDATGPVLLLENAAVFAAHDEIVIQRADRSQVRLPLAGAHTIRRMSDAWVQISTATGEHALRVTPGKEALYVLPAAPARTRRR